MVETPQYVLVQGNFLTLRAWHCQNEKWAYCGPGKGVHPGDWRLRLDLAVSFF
jgi:hypothetical protein